MSHVDKIETKLTNTITQVITGLSAILHVENISIMNDERKCARNLN